MNEAKINYEEKHDRGTFVKNIIMDNILPGDIYIRAKELHFSTDAPRAVFLVRQLGHGDVATVDVLAGMFPDKLQDFVLSINENDIAVVKQLTNYASAEELEKIARAQNVTDAAFAHILNFIKPEMTELEVALELEFFMRRMGAQSTAFDTIAVSGASSSLPHGVPSDVKLRQGFLTMDYGALFEGYCSDMTRTVVIGKADEEFEGIGRGPLNIEGLPVYRDAIGGIGTPTSDHERTKMGIETTHILALINGYSGEKGLQEAAEMTLDLLKKYADATEGEIVLY